MPSDLDNNTTTNVKPEMLSGVKTRNGIPHDKYNVCDIAHVHTNTKDNIFMPRRLVQSVVRQRSDYWPRGAIFHLRMGVRVGLSSAISLALLRSTSYNISKTKCKHSSTLTTLEFTLLLGYF